MVTATSIIMDAYLAPELLFAPRQLLVDYDTDLFNPATGRSASEWGTPHMQLLREIVSDGPVALSEVRSSHCAVCLCISMRSQT